MAILPKALVIRWDGIKLRVRCPYCLETHGHGYPLRTRRERRSDCPDGGHYQFVFPQDDDLAAAGYGWEFDRADSVFVAITSSGRVVDPNPWQPYRTLLPSLVNLHEGNDDGNTRDKETDRFELADVAERLNLNDEPHTGCFAPRLTDEALLEELLASPGFRHDTYISACIEGDLNELQRLFELCPEDNFNEQVGTRGDNGILYAAAEENGLEIVKWLHQRGASIDQINHYGRTPLMEAALWGRLETVRYLSAQSVNVQARDGNGMDALELAANSERNMGERASRGVSAYREPANANYQRARIEQHLKGLCSDSQLHKVPEHPERGFPFYQRTADGDLIRYIPDSLLVDPGSHPQKTFAPLHRGANYPLVTAMSGYTQGARPDVLDNSLWARRADDLRKYLELDGDISFSSHVEPQLLTYLVFHHSLVRFTDKDEELAQEEFQALSENLPPLTLSTITVSRTDMCSSCLHFLTNLGLPFQL